MKRRIRLTESDLHRVIKESMNKVLNEMTDEDMAYQNQRKDAYAYMALRRVLYLISEEASFLINDETPYELIKIFNEIKTIIHEALQDKEEVYNYSPLPYRKDFLNIPKGSRSKAKPMNLDYITGPHNL